jgi:outer membrane protein assembly factor BamB
MDATPKITVSEPAPWKGAGMRTAIVSGAFCLLVVALLVVNHFREKRSNPLNHPQMIELKQKLSANSNDEALKKEIRALDLKLRESQLRRVTMNRWGAVLLLGGVVVFLVSIKPATTQKKMSKPVKRTTEAYLREVGQTRHALLVSSALAVGVTVFAANQSETFLGNPAGTQAEKPAVATPAAPSFPSLAELKANWPRFRGPLGAGIAAFTNIPTTWNGTNGQNIVWKVEPPLYSPSSPVVWGDHIFLTGASATERAVYAYDLNGKLLWTGKVDPKRTHAEPPTVMEDTGGFGPSTPYTDGRRVYAIFANGDVAAFDFSGKQVWARNLGPFENTYGHASSLEMFQDRLIVQADQGAAAKDNKSKIYALDAATGQTVWETAPRPVPNSWATPIVIHDGKQDLLIANGDPWVMAYNPVSGVEIWRAKAMGGEVLPSPVYSDGIVFTAVETVKLRAIKVDGAGDITANNILWSAEEGLPDITGPLCDGPRVYLISSSGTMTCYDAKNGKKLWEHDIDFTVKGCATLVGDLIYVIGDAGNSVILRAGGEYQEVARSGLGEEVLSTAAIADGRLYIRGRKSLFCIGVK